MIVERVMVVIIALIGIVATIACGRFIKENKRYRNLIMSAARDLVVKDTKSRIERTVTVYGISGEIIERYEGELDVSYDSECIRIDEENGKNHIILYTTGTVIIDGKEKIK